MGLCQRPGGSLIQIEDEPAFLCRPERIVADTAMGQGTEALRPDLGGEDGSGGFVLGRGRRAAPRVPGGDEGPGRGVEPLQQPLDRRRRAAEPRRQPAPVVPDLVIGRLIRGQEIGAVFCYGDRNISLRSDGGKSLDAA